jgi:tetratricopeptide (TPR) repeat protein
VAGWGEIEEAAVAKQRLVAGLTIPKERVFANRLLLFVSSKSEDAEAYSQCLQRLQDWHEDTLADHSRYWLLLARNGHVEEAKSLAVKVDPKPRSAGQLIAVTDAYMELGLTEKALQCFKTLAPEFAESQGVWIAYAEALVKTKFWDELRALAAQMRTEGQCPRALFGYAYFLEGLAEAKQDRLTLAQAAFGKMNQQWTGNSGLALAGASELIRLGFANAARDLLAKFEFVLGSSADYWRLLFDAADQLRDADLLLKAAKHEFALNPNDVYVTNHYVAALLTSRQQADVAIALSLRLIAAFPTSVAARINHGLALVRNGRTEEAYDLLKTTRSDSLGPEEATSLYLGLFEVHYASRDYVKAARVLDHIDTKLLFPPDAAYLERCRKVISLPSTAPATTDASKSARPPKEEGSP